MPTGEIAGHLHPLARDRAARPRGQPPLLCRRRQRASSCRLSARYTGGLNIRDRAFAGLFDRQAFIAHMLGKRRLYAIAAGRCLPD